MDGCLGWSSNVLPQNMNILRVSCVKTNFCRWPAQPCALRRPSHPCHVNNKPSTFLPSNENTLFFYFEQYFFEIYGHQKMEFHLHRHVPNTVTTWNNFGLNAFARTLDITNTKSIVKNTTENALHSTTINCSSRNVVRLAVSVQLHMRHTRQFFIHTASLHIVRHSQNLLHSPVSTSPAPNDSEHFFPQFRKEHHTAPCSKPRAKNNCSSRARPSPENQHHLHTSTNCYLPFCNFSIIFHSHIKSSHSGNHL